MHRLAVNACVSGVLKTFVIHIGHEDCLGVFLVGEDVRFDELDAFIVETDLYPKIATEELEHFLPFDERIQTFRVSSEDEQGPKKINEDSI